MKKYLTLYIIIFIFLIGISTVFYIQKGSGEIKKDMYACNGNSIKATVSSTTPGRLWWVTNNDRSVIIPTTSSQSWYKKVDCDVENSSVAGAFFVKEIKIEREKLMAKGFIFNNRNSSETIETSDDYKESYVKGKDICTLSVISEKIGIKDGGFGYYMTLICGTNVDYYIELVSPLYSVLGITDNSVALAISKTEGDFIRGTESFSRGGTYFIAKKEPYNSYRLIYRGQDGLDCKLVEKEKIPESISNGCHNY